MTNAGFPFSLKNNHLWPS